MKNNEFANMLNMLNEAGSGESNPQTYAGGMEKVAEMSKMASLGKSFADGFMEEVGSQLEAMFQATMEKTAQEFIWKLADEFMSGPNPEATGIAGVPAPEQPGNPSEPAVPRVARTAPSTPAEVSNDMNMSPGMNPRTLGMTPPYMGPKVPGGGQPVPDKSSLEQFMETASPEEIAAAMEDPVLGPQLKAFTQEKVASMSGPELTEFLSEIDGESLGELVQNDEIRNRILQGLV